MADQRQLIAIAAEKVGRGISGIRMECMDDATREPLRGLIRQNIQPGSKNCTDGLPAFRSLGPLGYRYRFTVRMGILKDVFTTILPNVDGVASETLAGGVMGKSLSNLPSTLC